MSKGYKDIICKNFEQADKRAKEVWETLKKSHKQNERETFEEAIVEYREVMEIFYKAWPPVMEELGIISGGPSMEHSFLVAYAEAEKLGLPRDMIVKHGDHVAFSNEYRARRVFPWKR